MTKPAISPRHPAKRKSKLKHRKSGQRVARKASFRTASARSTGTSAKGHGSETKKSQVIALLCASSGATIEAMMQVTGWQQHSVRGFLAAVIRKKLNLDLRSEPTDKGRIYRIHQRASAANAKAAA